jgi:electron transfer flavoprotein alpha subunit
MIDDIFFLLSSLGHTHQHQRQQRATTRTASLATTLRTVGNSTVFHFYSAHISTMLSRAVSASAKRVTFALPNHTRQLAASSSRCWASTLVVSEPLVDGATPAATLSTATAAQQLGNDTVDLLVVGETPPTRIPAGITKVYHVPLSHHLSETVANAIETVAKTKDCNIVVGTSSKFGSTVIPRAAAQLDVSPVTDILEILAPGE